MKKIQSMVSRSLIVIMITTLLPGNIWAEPQELETEKSGVYSQSTPSNVKKDKEKSTPSNAELECFCGNINR